MGATWLICRWPMKAQLAENPTWISTAGLFAWVDILDPSYNLLDPTSGHNQRYPVHAKIGSAAPLDAGQAVVALADGLWLWQQGQELRPLPSPAMDGVHFNDGKCDPAGRFWVGTRSDDGAPGTGELYRISGDLSVTRMDAGFDVPNGLGWSPDRRYFYLVDTVPRLLYRYNFDLTSGLISNRAVIHTFDRTPGKPDGLAIDSAGNIWCAMWDGYGISVLSPEGRPIAWMSLPCPRPTSCAFGGKDLRTLLVTTANVGLDPDRSQLDGSGDLCAYRSEATGLPASPFSLLG